MEDYIDMKRVFLILDLVKKLCVHIAGYDGPPIGTDA